TRITAWRNRPAPFLARACPAGGEGRAFMCYERKIPRRLRRPTMFIAMNRFKIRKGSETAFEQVWTNRESYLDSVPGFVEFHLLKGPDADDHTLYASHT